MFAQVITLIFSVMLSLLNSDDFSGKAFFLQLHFYAHFLSSFTAYLSFNFRDISLKSQETFVHFFVMFHLILSGFYLFNLFVNCLFQAILFIRYLFVYLFVISSLVIVISLPLFLSFFVLFFELFSCLIYLFISCFVLVKLC